MQIVENPNPGNDIPLNDPSTPGPDMPRDDPPSPGPEIPKNDPPAEQDHTPQEIDLPTHPLPTPPPTRARSGFMD